MAIVNFGYSISFDWLFVSKKYGNIFDDLGTYGDFLGGSTIPFLTLFTMVLFIELTNFNKINLRHNKVSCLYLKRNGKYKGNITRTKQNC